MDADIVIIGGGTSGLVLANRLTENENIRVLVLEAGTDRLNDPRVMVPGLAPATYEDPEFDWNIISTPQALCSESLCFFYAYVQQCIAKEKANPPSHIDANIGTTKWSPTPSHQRLHSRQLLRHQSGHDRLAVQNWLERNGQIGQPRLGMG